MNYRVGIDLGGTAIKMVAVRPDGRELERAVQPTRDGVDRVEDWAYYLRGVLGRWAEALGGPADAVGLAAPGLAAEDGRSIAFLPGKMKGLEGLVWEEALSLKVPTWVVNDAHGALLGEVWVGAARGLQDVVLLTLGTGVGGAILSGGRLLTGAIGRAGHLGHLCLDPRGRKSITGMPGALEVLIGNATVPERTGGRFASTEELVRAYEAGDGPAGTWWLESVRALGCAVASVINILDPQRVVLAGGITRAGETLMRPLGEVLAEVEWRPGGHAAEVVISTLGEWAGALGAASPRVFGAKGAGLCR